MEAYDLLAECHHANNNAEDAQSCLLKAVEVSPISIQRQMTLGELALENGDPSVAEKAYRAAIGIGRNSIYKTPDNYTKLATTLAASGSGREAIRTLKGMRSDFPGDNVVVLQSAITESQVYQTLELDSAAKNARATATQLYEKLDAKVPPRVGLDFVAMQVAAGDSEAAMSVLGDLARNNYEDAALIEDIHALIQSVGLGDDAIDLVEQARSEINDLNNKAVMLFRDGQLEESMEIFRTLSHQVKANHTINMNTLRIHLEAAKKGVDREASLEFARVSLERISSMGMEDDKHRKLMEEYHQLIQQG